VFKFVNVAHLVDAKGGGGGDKGSACRQVLNNIAEGAGLDEGATEVQIRNKLNLDHGKSGYKHPVVLILDEIDLLLKLKGAGSTLLYTLFEWASNPNYLFTFVGVANTIDFRSRYLSKLGSDGEGAVPKSVIFPSYDTTQITEIVKQR
tara:strand:- start:267 stop:710 length:444 start_codon:yes stop_codon:yes gene_type:complete